MFLLRKQPQHMQLDVPVAWVSLVVATVPFPEDEANGRVGKAQSSTPSTRTCHRTEAGSELAVHKVFCIHLMLTSCYIFKDEDLRRKALGLWFQIRDKHWKRGERVFFSYYHHFCLQKRWIIAAISISRIGKSLFVSTEFFLFSVSQLMLMLKSRR